MHTAPEPEGSLIVPPVASSMLVLEKSWSSVSPTALAPTK